MQSLAPAVRSSSTCCIVFARRALCGSLVALAPLTAHAQELATAETESFLELDPPHLAGHPAAPRTRVVKLEPVVAAEPEELPDWFGGKRYTDWATATGNWGGIRGWFAERGVTFAASYTLDWSSVWSGGIRRRASTRSLLDANFTLDLAAIAGISGGEAFFDFYSTDGRGGSLDAGDTHGISNIQTDDNLDQIAELWYQQWLFDRGVRIKLGKVDANSEFGFVEAGGSFLNSGAGISGPVFALPTYPDPSVGANVFVYPTPWLYVGAGIYDGATADGIPTGRNGPATFFSDKRSDSWFSIAEAGVTWDRSGSLGAGRLAVGGWHHSADFERFDGGTERGVEGFYLVAEQQVVRGPDEDAERGLFAFARYAWTDENVSDAAQHVGGGLTLRGTLPGRPDDEAGVFVSTLMLSNASGADFDGDETIVELYYRFNLMPFVHITPDLQWIGNPSGDRSIRNAVVGAVRFEVDF